MDRTYESGFLSTKPAIFMDVDGKSRRNERPADGPVDFFGERALACAELFNVKVKAFRAQFGGVRNVQFFIFRLARVFK